MKTLNFKYLQSKLNYIKKIFSDLQNYALYEHLFISFFILEFHMIITIFLIFLSVN